MSNETHICVTCEEAKRPMLVVLDTNGKCQICGSEAVIPSAVMLSLLEKESKIKKSEAKAFSADRLKSFEASVKKRIDSLSDYYKTPRAFLERNKLHEINLWWDGFSFKSDESIHPLDPNDAPSAGQFEWVRYTFQNSDGTYRIIVAYFDPEEEGRIEVSEIQKKK